MDIGRGFARDLARSFAIIRNLGNCRYITLRCIQVVSLTELPSEFDWDELFTGGQARGGFVQSAA